MKKNDYTENNLYFKRAISLPIYPGLSKDKLRYIIKKIKLFLNKWKIIRFYLLQDIENQEHQC